MRQLVVRKNRQIIRTKEQWFQPAPPEGGEKQADLTKCGM